MLLANTTSGDACELPTQLQGLKEARLQPPVTNSGIDLPISERKQQPEAVAQMPNLVTSPNLSPFDDKQQSGSQTTMSSDVHSPRKPTTFSTPTTLKVGETDLTEMISTETIIEIVRAELAQMGEEASAASPVVAHASGDITGCEIKLLSDGAPFSDANAEATPASSVAEKDPYTTGMSNDEALAFLDCVSAMTDEDILAGFSNKTWNYPNIVNFACQAVKTIARERESEALLNWLDTGILEDPEQSGDRAELLPEVSHPFWWRIEDGEYGYPPDSIGQHSEKAGNNTYLCSQPMSVTVGTSGVTYYVHRNVLAISPVLERICYTDKAKKTAHITLPDDEPSVFEHLLGYLYFQKFKLPVVEVEWHHPNNIIMKTYVMAAKYGVHRLKPLLLKSLAIGTIEDLYSAAKTVYVANADDGDFREFFKTELMLHLERALEDGLYEPDLSFSVLNTLACWGSTGGNLGADVTAALANKVRAIHESNRHNETNPKCEVCGEMECQCQPADCEDELPTPGYYNKQRNPQDWAKNIETSTNYGQAGAGFREFHQESKASEVSTGLRELTDKVNHLVEQLGQQQCSGWGQVSRQSQSLPPWPIEAAQTHFRQQREGGSVIQGHPNEEDRKGWAAMLPVSPRRQLHPCMETQSGLTGRTAIAVQASDPWDCSITFPIGAIITDVKPRLGQYGESYLVGSLGGRCGTFPARYVQMVQ